MNTYRVQFVAKCPVNNDRVLYTLTIDHGQTIPAESIVTVISELSRTPMFHERLADRLSVALPGIQRLSADHRGVSIVTRREETTR